MVALAAGARADDVAAGATALADVAGVAVAAGVVVGAGVATSADVDFAAPTSGTTSGALADAGRLVAGAAAPPLGTLGGAPGHGGADVATTPAAVAADDTSAGGALPGHGGPPAGNTAPPFVRGDGVPRIISLGLGSCAHAADESNDTDTSAMVTTRSILLLYVHRRVQRDQPATPLL